MVPRRAPLRGTKGPGSIVKGILKGIPQVEIRGILKGIIEAILKVILKG